MRDAAAYSSSSSIANCHMTTALRPLATTGRSEPSAPSLHKNNHDDDDNDNDNNDSYGSPTTVGSLWQGPRARLQHCRAAGTVGTPFTLSPLADTAGHRTARGAKPIEVIGTYDPIPKPAPDGTGIPTKDIQLDVVRAKYWLGVGAQPSDPVWRLLAIVCCTASALRDRKC